MKRMIFRVFSYITGLRKYESRTLDLVNFFSSHKTFKRNLRFSSILNRVVGNGN